MGCLLLCSCTHAPAPTPSPQDRASVGYPDLPRDARKVAERMAGCLHWSGEDGYDADRTREINKALTDLRCDTIDQDFAAMRAKYAGDARILAILDSVQGE
jgi:hypothetical protein